jgi:mitogen-activated protein kinase kinase
VRFFLLVCVGFHDSTDIKPSNILFNSKGQIKICDFGVSGELINSIADTFVGTSTYMSVSTTTFLRIHHAWMTDNRRVGRDAQPERIQGAQYTVKSDVWSLGVSLIELALGRFPFSEDHASDDSDLEDLQGTLSPGKPLFAASTGQKKSKEDKDRKRKSMGVSLQGGSRTMSILELLQHIVNEPAPRLMPEGRFPKAAEDFVDACLLKDPEARKTPKELLVSSGL